MAEPWVEEAVGCPSCGEAAEPEDDGDTRYFACTVCEYEFGFRQVRQDATSCQLGISEQTRERLQPPARRTPVPVQIGKRP